MAIRPRHEARPPVRSPAQAQCQPPLLLRTRIKQVIKAIDAGDKTLAEQAYATAVPIIDRMAGNDIIHKNKASRHKSRLAARIKAMS